MDVKRTVIVNDSVYLSNGTPLGKCEQCGETAFHFDENGSALCEDCLTENHLEGKYDDEDDF